MRLKRFNLGLNFSYVLAFTFCLFFNGFASLINQPNPAPNSALVLQVANYKPALQTKLMAKFSQPPQVRLSKA